MKHRTFSLAAAAAVTTGCLISVAAAGEPKLPNCPIMGESVDFSVSTMTDDGPVYFCCPGCIKKFKKNPAKYAAELAEQRSILAKLDRIQVTCPVMGEPINPKVFTTYNGEKVNFCCKKCIKKFKQSPEKFRAALAASYTYQTRCPMSGEKIDPTLRTELADGSVVYTCCSRCAKGLKTNPAKYAAKLEAQGTFINVAKIQKAAASSGG